MPKKILKKREEHWSGDIVYNKDLSAIDFDSFEIIKSAEMNDHLWVKYDKKWRTKDDEIRYLENLLKIIKEEI
jgi:hypothetical protein